MKKGQLVKVTTLKDEFIAVIIEIKLDKIKVLPRHKDVSSWYEISEVKRFVPKKKQLKNYIGLYV